MSLVSNPANVALVSYDEGKEAGCGIFINHEPGVYEFHVAFPRYYRGRFAKKAVEQFFEFMFIRSDAITIWEILPSDKKAARAMAIATGAKREFERVGHVIYSVRYAGWSRKSSFSENAGLAFVTSLANHEDGKRFDPLVIDAEAWVYIGHFYRMLLSGQVEKAVILYNQIARVIGLPLVSLVSASPLLVKFGSALLFFDEERKMKVLKWDC